ncbi:uncharacterized protein LOC115483762 [Drosophila hydei]|uniref:Uncharacterized protein LOC115483762 n=1 Tax=Drosophila hydei TaxID=7224 RepID=A0A6J2T062_DROHY|nr:uncharacterized protein LOC115483762 [Drosophila hydei]
MPMPRRAAFIGTHHRSCRRRRCSSVTHLLPPQLAIAVEEITVLYPNLHRPLESHKLPNVTPTCNASPLLYNGSGSASSIASNSSFLGVRKPSLTLNSSDIRNNNDLFAFAKEMSPALELSDHSHSHSPMFTDITTAISPANSMALLHIISWVDSSA